MNSPLVIKGKEIGNGKPLVCVPVMEKTQPRIVDEVKRLVDDGCEMVEWRVDAFEAIDSLNAVRDVLGELGKIMGDTILVFTFRSKNQGGLLELPKDKLFDLHQVAAESKVVDFIDVEHFESKQILIEIHKLQKMGAHIISSHHDFNQTPSQDVIMMLLEQMGATGTDVVKLAVMPQSKEDVLTLLQATANFHEEYPNRPLITMSMGKLGAISRIAGETFGSCVTFGAAQVASAPGQLPYKELEHMLEVLHEEEN